MKHTIALSMIVVSIVGLNAISLYHILKCERLESQLAASQAKTREALKTAEESQLNAKNAVAAAVECQKMMRELLNDLTRKQ